MAKLKPPVAPRTERMVGEYRSLSKLVKDIRCEIATGLLVGGISANVKVESVKGTKLVRVEVISQQFAALRPSERQDLVWRILGGKLGRDDQLRISRILTLTPDELAGKWSD